MRHEQPADRHQLQRPPGCANLFISGTYSRSLTIASEGDIIVKPPAGSSNGDIIGTDDALLGLVANNFVRVYHRVTNSSSSNCANSPSTVEDPQMRDVRIDAAILSLQHSFIVDNYPCGTELGTLTVNGSIAQRFRGPVGTTRHDGTRSGYVKNYQYDDRLLPQPAVLPGPGGVRLARGAYQRAGPRHEVNQPLGA